MIALIIAILAGFFLCLSSIIMRKGMYSSGESSTAVAISCFTGVLVFGCVILVTGEAKRLPTLSWPALAYLSGAGVLHFVFGRMVSYYGFRLIGANRGNPITNFQMVVSVLLGVTVLGEPLTINLVLATILILAGIMLVSRTVADDKEGNGLTRKTLWKGVFAVLAGALIWGVTPLLIKMGLREEVSSLTGAFISYASAALIIGLLLFYPGNAARLRKLSRSALNMLVVSSVILSAGQLLRYMAIDYGSVSLVTPILGSMASLVVFPLSFLISRKIEYFGPMAIIGAVLVTSGILLIFLVA